MLAQFVPRNLKCELIDSRSFFFFFLLFLLLFAANVRVKIVDVQRGGGGEREREERADKVGLKEGEINKFIKFPSKYRLQPTEPLR